VTAQPKPTASASATSASNPVTSSPLAPTKRLLSSFLNFTFFCSFL
jgi:hypothetical protein